MKMMWPQVINAVLGVWLMAAPAVLGYDGAGRISNLIIGPFAATFAIVAMWEVVRPLGKLNVALGGWLVVAPLLLNHGSMVPVINSFVVGILMIALALMSGNTSDKFGGGWRALAHVKRNSWAK
jgi:hypothetical protein